MTGWFAALGDDDDPERLDGYPWRAYLQLDGWCPPIDVWFPTQEAAEKFIRDEIIGKEMLP